MRFACAIVIPSFVTCATKEPPYSLKSHVNVVVYDNPVIIYDCDSITDLLLTDCFIATGFSFIFVTLDSYSMLR